MSKVKNAILEILDCDLCLGQGVTGWASPDGDFDFEYCDCNPNRITQDEIWAYEEEVSA